MKANVVITMCMCLVCIAEVAGSETKIIKSGQNRTTSSKPANIEFMNTERKTLNKEFSDLKDADVEQLKMDNNYNHTSMPYVYNTTVSLAAGNVTQNITRTLSTYDTAVKLRKNTYFCDNIQCSKKNSVGQVDKNIIKSQSQIKWKNLDQISLKNDSESNYKTVAMLIRNKREVNETEPNDELLDTEELPKPESLAWVGHIRHANQGPANVFGKRVVPYQNRLNPNHLGVSSSSPTTYRKQHGSNNPNLNHMNMPTIKHQDQFPISNSHGPPQNSRQYHVNESPYQSNPRFRDNPSYPQPNYYPRPTFSSLSSAGASLLNMLNPLNLFRTALPPPLPYNPNPIPPANYDPRQPRRPLERPIPHNSFEGKENPDHNYDVDYEIVDDPLPHQYGHEYMTDSPLREDIYIGKDGNLYVRENKNGREENSYRQTHSGGSKRPDERRPYSKPYRPEMSPPRGRFEEYNDDNYEELLKNHNMDEDFPQEFPASVQDYFPENSDNQDYFPENSNNYNFNSEGSPFDYDDSENNVNVQNPTKPSQQNRFNWMPNIPGRINYPSYFYGPRQVVLPGFQYRTRPRWPIIPPRAGTPVIPPNVKFQRPMLSRTSPPRRLPPQVSPSYPRNKPNTQITNLNSETTRFKDTTKSNRPEVSPKKTNKIRNGHGFYPGNGFFDADFPTVFQMSPSHRHRVVEALPRPMYQNGTILTNKYNITGQVYQNKSMEVDGISL